MKLLRYGEIGYEKPGLMDIYIKVNSRIVFGAAKALYTFQMVQRMKENGPMDL